MKADAKLNSESGNNSVTTLRGQTFYVKDESSSIVRLFDICGEHFRPDDLQEKPYSMRDSVLRDRNEWEQPLLRDWNSEQQLLFVTIVLATLLTLFWVNCESRYVPDFVFVIHIACIWTIPIVSCWQLQTLVYKQCSHPEFQLLVSGFCAGVALAFCMSFGSLLSQLTKTSSIVDVALALSIMLLPIAYGVLLHHLRRAHISNGKNPTLIPAGIFLAFVFISLVNIPMTTASVGSRLTHSSSPTLRAVGTQIVDDISWRTAGSATPDPASAVSVLGGFDANDVDWFRELLWQLN